MREKIAFPFAVLAASAIMTLTASIAAADDFPCPPSVTGEIFGNVVVPPGATCIMTNATVHGNVKALENSRLRISGSNIRGNVEGDKADIVQIFSTRVRQYILIKEGGPAEGPAPQFNACFAATDDTPCEALLARVTIEDGGIQIEKMVGDVLVDRAVLPGDFQVEDNSITGLLVIQNTTVDQNLQVLKNTGAGDKRVQGNEVGANLQCFENDQPFAGQFNTAGQAEGQCAPPASP